MQAGLHPEDPPFISQNGRTRTMRPPFRVSGFRSIHAGCFCARQHKRHPGSLVSRIGRYVVVGLLLAVAPFLHGKSFGQLVNSWPHSSTLGHTAWVAYSPDFSVAFSPDGSTVASASYDRTIRLWDVATGESTQTLVHTHRVTFGPAFSPDGSRPLTVVYSPDGSMLASGAR